MTRRNWGIGWLAALGGMTVLTGCAGSFAAGPAAHVVPDPVVDETLAKTRTPKTMVVAGGCFWCTEAVCERIKGVEKVVSGYAGGDASTAKYRRVSEGDTGHAESIEITYDASRITYGKLLKIFFGAAHDPTQKDRQGPDWGKQYRSAIFAKDAEQKKIALAYIKQLNDAKVFAKPIVTEVVDLKGFYPAEGYHQDFVKNNPDNPYVEANAVPKVEKLERLYPDLVKK